MVITRGKGRGHSNVHLLSHRHEGLLARRRSLLLLRSLSFHHQHRRSRQASPGLRAVERATSLSRPRTSPQLVGAVFLGVRPSTASSRHCGGCHASPLRRSMETNHHGRVGSLHSLRGTHTRVHSETSTLTRPKRTSVGTRPVSRSHRRLTGQTGGGEGTRPFFSRFLQTSFLSTKEKRQMETSDRPKDLTLFLSKPTFKMETTALIKSSFQPGHWGVSLDLSDAFFHVPIHPNTGNTFALPSKARFSSSGQCLSA